MSVRMSDHARKNTALIALFDEFLLKRPDLLDEIPNHAILVMQLEGDKTFNAWAREIAEANADGSPLLFIEFSVKVKARTSTSALWRVVASGSWEKVRMELRPMRRPKAMSPSRSPSQISKAKVLRTER